MTFRFMDPTELLYVHTTFMSLRSFAGLTVALLLVFILGTEYILFS